MAAWMLIWQNNIKSKIITLVSQIVSDYKKECCTAMLNMTNDTTQKSHVGSLSTNNMTIKFTPKLLSKLSYAQTLWYIKMSIIKRQVRSGIEGQSSKANKTTKKYKKIRKKYKIRLHQNSSNDKSFFTVLWKKSCKKLSTFGAIIRALIKNNKKFIPNGTTLKS